MTDIRITTYSGKFVDPFSIAVTDINIIDIAHALSMQSRFNGHCSRFYSVAEHSILVSTLVPREFALDALLHDAAEAYVGDVPGPIKARLKEFVELETSVYAIISKRFNISCEPLGPVKSADREALRIEMSALMSPHDCRVVTPLELTLGLSPSKARRRFLRRFDELRSAAPHTQPSSTSSPI